MKKIISTVLSIMLIMSIFTGCSGSAENNSNGNEPSSNNTVLTCGINQDIDNFDPFTNQQLAFVNMVNFNCYECLFHYDENMELSMDLATGYEQIDDITYVFNLRNNVTFHNGEAFTAEDVIYTINTIKDDATGAWRKSQYENVAEMTAIDEYTLEVKLNNPQANFIDNLAYTAIVSKSTTPQSLTVTPIGTGAFKFVSWTPNSDIKFEKYNQYWESDKVTFEKFEMKVIPDTTVALTNLKSGSITYMGLIDAETANIVKNTDNLKLIQSKFANTIYELEVGRHNHPALADPEVMKALFLAFDRETIAQTAFAGMATSAKSPFPSASNFYKAVDTEGYDIEKAKSVLANTEYADGFEFEVYVLSGDVVSEQAMVIWQSELKKLGIDMKVTIAELSVWLDAYLSRSYDMIANYYSMVGSDPSTYCSVILSALADYQTGDIENFNALMLEAAQLTDDAERAVKYEELQRLIVEYRPVVSYVECPNLNAAVSSLENVIVNGMGHTILKYATI